MNNKVALAGKAAAIAGSYGLLFLLTVFLTVSILVKGDEISAPDLVGMPMAKAYAVAAKKGVFLKKSVGVFGASFPPGTVVSQFPAPQTSVKEKSVVKVFVAADVGQVIVPPLVSLSLKEAETLLKKNGLKRGHAAFMTVADAMPDSVVGQSPPVGAAAAEGSAVDLLVSRGGEPRSFIMPDLIGQEAAQALLFFEKHGLKLAKIEEVPYFGLRPGVILKQFPSPGFEISAKNQIAIQVSK